jgi:hypothetical protein
LSAKLLLMCVLASLPALARADDEKGACLAQHESGQLSRRAGRFDAAREQFAACTADACPPPVQRRCIAFLAELDAAQPTVVIAVHDAGGRDIVHGVSMTLDGARRREVPATAVQLDPGEHTLRLFRGTEAPVDRSFLVREGEKDKRIEVTLAPPRTLVTPAADTATSRVTPGARWLIGVSAVSLVGAGATSAAGWAIRGHLESSCSPTCSSSQVDSLRILWPTSFAMLGVGVLTGAIAVTLVLTTPATPVDRTSLRVLDNGVGWVF